MSALPPPGFVFSLNTRLFCACGWLRGLFFQQWAQPGAGFERADEDHVLRLQGRQQQQHHRQESPPRLFYGVINLMRVSRMVVQRLVVRGRASILQRRVCLRPDVPTIEIRNKEPFLSDGGTKRGRWRYLFPALDAVTCRSIHKHKHIRIHIHVDTGIFCQTYFSPHQSTSQCQYQATNFGKAPDEIFPVPPPFHVVPCLLLRR